jgi:hypothetical protein
MGMGDEDVRINGTMLEVVCHKVIPKETHPRTKIDNHQFLISPNLKA